MKIRSVALLLFLCATPSLCKAFTPTASSGQLVITEVMYDPPATDYGHEWIEVYNAGNASVVLSQDKILEGGAKHNIIAVPPAGGLAPGSYAVIAENAANFEKDHPDFSGQLFHSAISLDNAGATIQIVNASSTGLASATYDSGSGALGDGNSLQRAPGDVSFVARTPSPGASISSSVIPTKTKPVAVKKTTTHAASTTKPQQTTVADDSNYAPSSSHDADATTSQAAAADAPRAGNAMVWWIAAAALALASAAALVFSKRYKKREWNIVEER